MTDESNKDFIDIFGEYVEEPRENKSDGYNKHKRLTKPSFKDQMYLARQRARAKIEAEQAAEEMDEFSSGGLAKLLGE